MLTLDPTDFPSADAGSVRAAAILRIYIDGDTFGVYCNGCHGAEERVRYLKTQGVDGIDARAIVAAEDGGYATGIAFITRAREVLARSL